MTLGDYRLGERLGEGASGTVVAAVHCPTGLPVAIKQVLCDDFRDRARVEHEVAAMARMSHRHIIPVYESGTDGQTAWFAMERAAGRWGERAFSGGQLTQACREVLLGLAHAHARKVLHRDVKPENLLIAESGVIRIADFGIASVSGGGRLAGVGTPKFMAPEQSHLGADEGPWTDLYALGKVVLDGLADPDCALAEWARWLSAESPGRRPHCAASALAALPSSDASDWRRSSPPASTEQTRKVGSADGVLAPMAAAWMPTDVPSTWWEAPAPPPVVDGVWRLRSSPGLIGRSALQEQLWSVVTGPMQNPVVLQGDPGVGVGALLDWLATHAGEVGVPVLRIGSDSLRDVLTDWLGGHTERALVSQALYRLGADVGVAQDLSDLAKTGVCGGDRVRAIAAWVSAQVGRPLVVIDSVDLQSEPVSLLLGMWRAGVDMQMVSRCGLPDATVLTVPALASDDVHQALDQLAPLTPKFQSVLVERFGADLGAMQEALLHGVDAGWLVRTPTGLGLSDHGLPPVVRPSLSASQKRLGALVAGMGGRVSDAVWDALCATCGVNAEQVATLPWVERVSGGWSVSAGRHLTKLASPLSSQDARAVADALATDVPDSAIRGAVVLWNAGLCDAASARLLCTIRECDLPPSVAVAQCERLMQWRDDDSSLELVILYSGRLADAGRYAEAIALVQDIPPDRMTPAQRARVIHAGYRVAMVTGDPAEALALNSQAELPPDHPDFLRWLSDQCIALFALGRFDDVEQLASSVPEHAEIELWRVRGEASLYRGDIELAERCLASALVGNNIPSLCYVLQLKAACLQQRGDMAGAELWCVRAAEAGVGRQDGLQAMTNAALIAALRGRDATACARAEQVLPRLRRLGWKQNEAYALAVLWATTPDPVLAAVHGHEARLLIDKLELPDPDLDALARRFLQNAAGHTYDVSETERWLARRGAP